MARKMADGRIADNLVRAARLDADYRNSRGLAGGLQAARRTADRAIETDRNIALIEQPEYKRRWNTEPWESQLERALRSWLLDRLESYFDFDGG